MPFRVSAKNFFVTYPQCNLSKNTLIIFLKSKFPTATYILVSEEQHEDGSPHLHAFISTSIKKDIKSETYLDTAGFHPNIQAAREPAKVIEYVAKHGNILEWGTRPVFNSGKNADYSQLLQATTKEEFMNVCQQQFPHEYIFQHDRVQYYCDQKFQQRLALYKPRFTEFITPNVVQQWIDQRKSADRPRSLILWGPSRLGKTELARSFGKHMYFNLYFDIRLWDDTAEYAVWDDLDSWAKFPYKQWIGAQQQFTVTDKYARKRTVQWGKPSIVLMNEDPASIEWNYEWIKANCFILKISNKLY